MTKTDLTRDLEVTLAHYWATQGAIAVAEVTLPDDFGIVDTLVLQTSGTKHTWRCFELKVTKADFHSNAKLSFIGDYNYFVLPESLYLDVQKEIPAGIGVLTYQPFAPEAVAASQLPVAAPGTLTVARAPRRQALQVQDEDLMLRLVISLNREVQKTQKQAGGVRAFSDQQLVAELRRRSAAYQIYAPEDNLYDQFATHLQNTTIAALQEEVDALTAELAAWKLGWRP